MNCHRCRTELRPHSVFCHACGKRIGRVVTSGRRTAAQALLIIDWLACFVAALLIAFFDVETVMGTGPVIFLLGLATGIVGLRLRHPGMWLLGAGHVAICVFLTVLVNILQWSPADATEPFTIMGTAYVSVTAPLSLVVLRCMPAVRQPWECERCGYLLHGLSESRCPECGTPFDPDRVRANSAWSMDG